MIRVIRRMVIAVAIVAGLLVSESSLAGPLDPNAFASLGTFPSLAGSYTVNTSGTPTITMPGGGIITGVVYQDTPGHSLAVFAFSSINITSGETLTATGSVPLVLLSQSDVTISGTINGNGTNGVGGPGGGGPQNPGPGAGNYIFEGGSGGGFGGSGGSSGVYTFRNGIPPFINPPIPSLPGGGTYGNLSVSLQGGSAGGSLSGTGGGGIEIGAVKAFNLLAGGVIEANGASQTLFGGGGSGGGIFLHGTSLSIASGALVSAQGGNGGGTIFNGGPGGGQGGGGGGGGGGQILFQFSDVPNSQIARNTFNVMGGAAGSFGPFGGPPPIGTTDGGLGAVFINQSGNIVPEPSSFVMVAMAAVIGLGGKWCRRRRPSRV